MNKFIKWLPDILFIILILAARSSLADHYHVPSGSMEFTLMPGDHVIVDKTAYGIEFPFLDFEIIHGESAKAGEVAIFDSPVDGKRLIKRIVAVGGDRVALHNGHLYLNGARISCRIDTRYECFDKHLAKISLSHGSGLDIMSFVVPAGKVLAIGDSRGNSLDSRYYGLIDESALYGRAVAVFYRKYQGFLWQRL